MEHQDWNTIYTRLDQRLSHKKNGDAPCKKKYVKSNETEMEEKIEEGSMSHKKTPAQFGKDVQKFRLEKHWTQKDLAQRINLTSKIITDIENGTAKHNPQVIQKIKRLMK